MSIQVSLCWQMFIFAVSVSRTAVYMCIDTSRAEFIPNMHRQGWVLFPLTSQERSYWSGENSELTFGVCWVIRQVYILCWVTHAGNWHIPACCLQYTYYSAVCLHWHTPHTQLVARTMEDLLMKKWGEDTENFNLSLNHKHTTMWWRVRWMQFVFVFLGGVFSPLAGNLFLADIFAAHLRIHSIMGDYRLPASDRRILSFQ